MVRRRQKGDPPSPRLYKEGLYPPPCRDTRSRTARRRWRWTPPQGECELCGGDGAVGPCTLHFTDNRGERWPCGGTVAADADACRASPSDPPSPNPTDAPQAPATPRRPHAAPARGPSQLTHELKVKHSTSLSFTHGSCDS